MKRVPSKPLYWKIKQAILKWIEDGEYGPGDLLPSEKRLQEEFFVSRTTVRMAMKELEEQGYVVRRPGKGTFIAKNKMNSGPRRLLSFCEELRNCGMVPSSQIILLEREFPPEKILRKLELEDDQFIWKLERVRLADGAPVALEINHISSRYIRKLDASVLKKGSLYQYIEEEYGIVATYAQEKVEARLANLWEAKKLSLAKGSPVFFVERLTFGYIKGKPMEQVPIEIVQIVYSAEKYVFNLIITKEE